MWIRLDCPNGHPVKVDEKFAGRMGRCPMCGEKIRIPPATTASPDVSDDDILDFIGKAVAPLSGKPSTASKPAAVAPQADVHASPALAAAALEGDSSTIGMSPATSAGGGGSAATLAQQTRVCPNCKRKVSVRYQICPHCRTYMPITGVGQGSTLLRGQPNISNCPHCGVRSFPGATVCNNCGEPLS